MNQYASKITVLLMCSMASSLVHADAMISLYLKPYPALQKDIDTAQASKTLKKPSALAKSQLRFFYDQNLVSGIFATYGGNVAISDLTGHLIFPYRHTTDRIYLVITERMTPVIMFANTLAHWTFEPKTPVSIFKMERLKDEQTDQLYWNVEPEDLPENNIIPLESLVILAKPKHVFVPTGITLTNESPHLLLPDIYIRKGIAYTRNALYMLNIKHFFGTIAPASRIEKNRYIQHHTR